MSRDIIIMSRLNNNTTETLLFLFLTNILLVFGNLALAYMRETVMLVMLIIETRIGIALSMSQ